MTDEEKLLRDVQRRLREMVRGTCNDPCPCLMCSEVWSVIELLDDAGVAYEPEEGEE
jgi:hypothetical protein